MTIRNRITGVNVPAAERLVSGLAGASAIAFGLARQLRGFSPAGAIAVATGAAFVGRAITGRCPGYRARAIRKGITIRRAITIQCTPHDAYAMLRDLPSLPRSMAHVDSVTVDANGVSTWVVCAGPKHLTWRARLVDDEPDRRLRWRSLPGGDLVHEGSIEIREAPADRGTVVEIKLHYMPPGGLVIASAFYELLRTITTNQLAQELARLQQLLETGEITVGARRLEDLDDSDVAVASTQLAPAPAPDVTAETSRWPVTGGAR